MSIENAQIIEGSPSSPEVHSPYYPVALDMLSGELAKSFSGDPLKQNQELGRDILDNIDKQGIDNFAIFESERFPGVQIPYVRISMNEVIKDFAPSEPQRSEERKERAKTIYVISSGFAFPPAGHPFTPWDIVYDRVIGLVPESISVKKKGGNLPDIYVIGSPNSLWGKVTSEWIEELKVNGFGAYGEILSELMTPKLRDEITGNHLPRIVLQGMSLGSTIMQETKRRLPEDLLGRTQLLLDNPVLSHNKFQVPLGFLGESILRMTFDRRLQKSMSHEKDFYSKSKNKLKEKGIQPVDDKKSTALKQQAAFIDVRNLMELVDLPEGEKTFIRMGLYDPVSFSLKKIRDRINVYKKYSTHGLTATDNIYPINTTHFIDRYRVKKWARIINGINTLKDVSSI